MPSNEPEEASPGCTHDFSCCSPDIECSSRRTLPASIEEAIRITEQRLNALLPDGVFAKFDRTPLTHVGVDRASFDVITAGVAYVYKIGTPEEQVIDPADITVIHRRTTDENQHHD